MAGAEQRPEHGSRLPQSITNAFDNVRRRLNPEQPTEEDRTWAAYMGKKRDWREFAALVANQDVQPAFHQRAIQVLLAPNITRLPFAVNVDRGLNTYTGVSNHWTESLTDEQAQYVAGLIPDYIRQAREVAQEADRKNRSDYSARKAAFTYNDLIPRLLSRLPEEQAEALFEHFDINDPLTYYNMDTASGYNPLEHLLRNGVDESWKRKAVARMHERIEREQTGEAHPRGDWEGAAGRYRSILSMMHYGDELPVSREFYQQEMKYMLGVETDKPIVDQWHTGKALDLLEGEDVRHAFARRQVLSGEPDSFDRFKVYDGVSAQTARQIIGEFPDDAELRTYLEQQLQKYAVRAAEQREQQEQAARAEQDVFQKMRKPSSI